MKSKHLTKFFIGMALYVVIIFTCVSLAKGTLAGSQWLWGIMLLPVLPVGYALKQNFQAIAEMDELMRRIHLEAMVISAFATGFITFAWGLLEFAGLPAFEVIYVLPMLIVFWSLGTEWRKRLYR
jgi:hypothetical protein